jgi:hypothetical protein
MDTAESDLLHSVIEACRKLSTSEQNIYLSTGALLQSLFDAGLHKKQNDSKSFRVLLVSSGISDLFGKGPAALDLCRRVTAAAGHFITSNELSIVPSRAARLLPFAKDKETYHDLIKECCQTHIPDATYREIVAQKSGKPDLTACNHEAGHEYWTKCKNCHKWTEENKA